MPNEAHHKFIASPYKSQLAAGKLEFTGFASPTSSTTYTPNQFFDVVMPNASRGCLRIVAYLVRKTLGWCDAHGNPQHEQIEVAHRELERKAGVGHGMIRDALDEAVAKHFIECLRAGRSSTAGDFGESAVYALKWDATPLYARSLADFRGFYEGEGHRTDIPNEFFDRLIPKENLSVIKVVGSVIRYSIGFQAKHGRRRQQATLAYSQILKAFGLSSRRTLAGAIREAIGKKYIVRLDAGYFSARVAERRSATYAVRWSDGFHEKMPLTLTGDTAPKRTPATLWINQSEKDTSGVSDRSDPATKTTPKRTPADHPEKDTIETKPLNEIEKQQTLAADLLKKEGFDPKTAGQLATKFPLTVIHQQIHWLAQRNVTKSRAGLLRRAIEGNWPSPSGVVNTPRSVQESLQHPGYLNWLAEQEQAYRQESPGDYERFLTKRERRRKDLDAERSLALREQNLACHDRKETRLAEFQAFMGLPSLRQWDAEIKHQTFTQS